MLAWLRLSRNQPISCAYCLMVRLPRIQYKCYTRRVCGEAHPVRRKPPFACANGGIESRTTLGCIEQLGNFFTRKAMRWWHLRPGERNQNVWDLERGFYEDRVKHLPNAQQAKREILRNMLPRCMFLSIILCIRI